MLKSNLTDNLLWRSVCAGSTTAFRALIDRHWEAVYTTAFSYLQDRDMAMEISNDTFLNIWQKRDLLDIHSFRNYLTTSARYHVYKVLKAKRALKLAYVADYDNISNLNVTYNSGEDKIRYMDIRSEIETHLSALPPRCREIFLLSRLGNLTNTEIAEKLSISKRTVENQISIAQKYVQRNFKPVALGLIIGMLLQ